ncbi:Piwi-domain-containing protein [Phellopilus nigrolimitatus]|nr:Piwi-domain-containing protein [Phellopilus nigrolimitatus]
MACTFATRPPKGSKGKVFAVSTNCFRLSIIKPMRFCHYHVITGEKEVKNVRRRKEILTKLYAQVAPEIFQPGEVVYDGKASLFTEKDLDFGERNFEVNEMSTPPPSGSTKGLMKVTLTRVGNVQSQDFEAVLKRQGQSDNALSFQQVLNLLLHNSTPARFRQVTTKTTLFSQAKMVDLRLGFELWRGCFASVRPSFDHALLNVDVSSAIMYERGDLINVSMHLLNFRNPRELDGPEIVPRLLNLLKTVRVRQVHAGKIGRIRTIKKLISRAGRYVFHLQDGSQTTVQQYFLNSLGYRLKFPDLPGIIVIKHGQKYDDAPDVIPFELLDVIEGQMFKRKLDPTLEAQVRKFTTVNPEARKKIIMDCVQAFNPTALAAVGLHVEKNLVSMTGRLLSPPNIGFAQGQLLRPDEGVWKVSRRAPKRFFMPAILQAWAVLCYDGRLNAQFCQNFLEKLLSCMDSLGFILLVILPHGGSAVYRRIKEIGDTARGPGLMSDKLENLSSQYLFNLLFKINTKLGGINSVPLKGGMELVHENKEPVMIVGMDVSHPRAGIMRPSVAGLVWSVDRYASKYFASCAQQPPRLEIDALKSFSKFSGWKVLPWRIVVYRDGVSEGEFVQVADVEFKAIKDAITKTWKEAPPNIKRPPAEQVKVTFIVVGKSHHIRFFPQSKSQADFSGNCPSGFVADVDDIANPNIYDFYLQSHSASRPAHYIVIRDENKLDSDSLQGLSFGLCHAFARATRAVSIPAPLVCRRADIHIRYNGDESDSNITGSRDTEYNADDWDFKPVHGAQRSLMYFI